MDPKSLRDLGDQMKQKVGSGVVVLASVKDGKAALIAAVTKDLTDQISASAIISDIASKIGGKGGGRPDMAQGGGTDIAALDETLSQVDEYISPA